jgi:hypothetical protein
MTTMTPLDADAAREQWGALERTYRERMGASYVLPQQVRSLLVQRTSDPEVWQLLAIWRSQDELEAYRRSVETPGGAGLPAHVRAQPDPTDLNHLRKLKPDALLKLMVRSRPGGGAAAPLTTNTTPQSATNAEHTSKPKTHWGTPRRSAPEAAPALIMAHGAYPACVCVGRPAWSQPRASPRYLE